ncbi:hypothetical protein Q5O24_05705 [Eubacteriaceae bacterium ES3]|nr:hypothetical protein Q5O24_05705 [Eubacteriaceae bacterium ES3]
MKNKSFLDGTIFLLLMLSLLLLSGCNQSTGGSILSDPFNFYNMVELGESKEQVESSLGVTGVLSDGTYQYVDEETGFGVMVVYDSGDTVEMKTLYNADETKIMELSDASVTEDQGSSITEGMSYDKVVELLGTEGVEIIQMVNPSDIDKPIHMMIWFNDDNSGLYVTFLGEKGLVLSVNFYNE